MNTESKDDREIGREAISELQIDLENLKWLKALMWAIRHEADSEHLYSQAQIKNLAEIGGYLIECRTPIIEAVCRSMESDLEQYAGAQ